MRAKHWWVEGTALSGAIIATGNRVWICWVESWVATFLAISRVRAIGLKSVSALAFDSTRAKLTPPIASKKLLNKTIALVGN